MLQINDEGNLVDQRNQPIFKFSDKSLKFSYLLLVLTVYIIAFFRVLVNVSMTHIYEF